MTNDAGPVADDALRSVWNVVGGLRVHGCVGADALGGMPLVFVHGLGVSMRYMEPTMARLARTHRVAALDLPGFGRSDTPGRALTTRELATMLALWLDARDIGPAIFVGNSYGCQVIVECAIREPARAAGLVLNAPTMDPAHRSMPVMLARVAADVPREPLRLALIVARDYLRVGPVRLLTTLAQALRHHIEELLPRLTMPVLVVAGARDPVITVRWAEEVVRLVGMERDDAAGAELQVVPDAAHALPYDDPETFAALIAAFAARVAARRGVGAAAARA